jgi:hypothetical protein
LRGKITAGIFLLIFCIIPALPAFALDGMVVRVGDNGNIVVNRGINQGAQPGADLYVSRLGTPIAIIRIVQVDEYRSECRVMEVLPHQSIEMGDAFSTDPFDRKKEEPPRPAASATPSGNTGDGTGTGSVSSTPQDYKQVVAQKTRVLEFKRGPGGSVKVKPYDALNMVQMLAFSGPYASFNAWYAVTGAYSMYSGYKQSQNPNQVRNIQIEITLWDAEYLDAFAYYQAGQEQMSDPSHLRESMYKQKGLDKFYVFQVKIINPGPGSIQLAPFPMHCYMKGPGDKKLKAVNYDEVLDKALNPTQVVNGYIYFSRYDENGQPVMIRSDQKIVLILEDVLGHRGEASFN